MKRILLFIAGALALASCETKQKPSDRVNPYTDTIDVEAKTIVKYQDEGNGKTLTVWLNGIPFNTVWDTGASMTLISMHELETLDKHGKIKLSDWTGLKSFSMADGSETYGPKFNIKELYIKGQDERHSIRLTDIEVTVSLNPVAPLLLGMDVIGRLGNYTDNQDKQQLEIETVQ